MANSVLLIWLIANILFFAINFFIFQLLNGKLWKKLNLKNDFTKEKFVFVLGNFLVLVLMYGILDESNARVVDLCSKNQIVHRKLIDFMALSLGFSVLWNVVSDRFSKLLLQILTKRNELIETEVEGSYYFAVRMTLYFMVALSFAPIVSAIVSSLMPQIELPNIIR